MVPGVSRAGKQSGQALWAFQTRMRTAKLRHAGAAPEDVAWRAARRLDKSLFRQLLTGKWIKDRRNPIVTGLNLVIDRAAWARHGWLASSASKRVATTPPSSASARHGCSASWNSPTGPPGRLLRNRLPRKGWQLSAAVSKSDLLILDDRGPDRLAASQRRDLMEIVEDRYGTGATLPLGDCCTITCRATDHQPAPG